VILVRIIDGVLRKGMKIKMMSTNDIYTVETVWIFTPKKEPIGELKPGEVGYITAAIRQPSDCNVGDTITEDKKPCAEALTGFKKVMPVVFCSLYPTDAGSFEILKDSLTKLHLNDASFTYEVESSNALGFGFRCGFLGLLHLEIIQERLMREFNVDLITTSPSVIYRIHLRNSSVMFLHNPNDMPDPTKIEMMEEPWVKATMMLPDEYLGAVLDLCTQKRGEQISLTYVGDRIMLIYRLPLNEIVYDFYDDLKSCSRGYASFDWEFDSYRPSELVVMKMLVNGEAVDALATILHRSKAESRGRELCMSLKDLIPRHMFAIPIQAAIGARIVARETISAMRKDVTAKCYGGDITRKRKLLEKQKEGKKRMREIGRVSIPQSAFIAVLKTKK
jgi:GTP-binding protein LepA